MTRRLEMRAIKVLNFIGSFCEGSVDQLFLCFFQRRGRIAVVRDACGSVIINDGFLRYFFRIEVLYINVMVLVQVAISR